MLCCIIKELEMTKQTKPPTQEWPDNPAEAYPI